MGKRKKNEKADGSSIIVVARDVELTRRVEGLFQDGRTQVDRELNIDRVLERFESEPYDVLLITSAAFKAGEIDGIELLEVIAAKSPATQVLFLVKKKDIKIAMSALTRGLTEAMDEGWAVLKRMHRWDELRQARVVACKKGLDGEVGSVRLRGLAWIMLDLADLGLHQRGLGEGKHLDPLRRRVMEGACPAA